jgi:hypothetical protein
MISLLESETFKKEYQKYKNAIDILQDDKIREDAKLSLAKLVNEIKVLDSQNQEMFFSRNTPTRLDETKKKINNLRKELDNFIKKSI